MSENNNNEGTAATEELEAELSGLEQSLQNTARGGRAVFNSIATGLSNLRRRIDDAIASSTLSGAGERLRDRVSTAQLAHSSRRPLDVVRQAQQQQQSDGGGSSNPLLRLTGNNAATSTTTSTPRAGGGQATSPPLPRASSVLMASRVKSSGNRNSAASAPPSSCGRGGGDNLMDDKSEDELFSKELHEQAKKRARTQKQQQQQQQRESKTSSGSTKTTIGEDNGERKPQPTIPAKVLLTRAQSYDAINNSIVSVLSQESLAEGAESVEVVLSPSTTPTAGATTQPFPEQQQQQHYEDGGGPGSLIYSWGMDGNLTLHDDDAPRATNNDPSTYQLDTKTSRLAKAGSPALVSVACGDNHTVCATQSGSVYVCGYNEKGCLGLASAAASPTKATIPRPTRLELSQPILQVSCGLDHTAAVTTNGTVLSWGSNQQGQLGHRIHNNNKSSSFCPPQAMMLSSSSNQTTTAAAVACGHYFTLVLTNRMCVLACGVDYIAPHGSPIPVTIPALIGLPLVFIAAGHNHAVVLTSSGTAFSWGINDSGCCGRSYPNCFNVPVEMHLPDTTTASTSAAPSSANDNPLRTSLSTCSSNSTSQSSPSRTRQQQRHPFRNWAAKKWQPNNSLILSQQQQAAVTECVMSIADDVAIGHATCGQNHTVLVTRSGRLLYFGNNKNTQICDGQNEQAATSPAKPVYHPEGGDSVFVAAEAGTSHTLLLDNKGNVWQITGRPQHRDGDVVLEGPDCVLRNKNILNIASGGNGNHVAIAQGAATPRFSTVRRRFFPIAGMIGGGTNKLLTGGGETAITGKAKASNEMALQIADNLDELVDQFAVESCQRHNNNSSLQPHHGSSRELAAATEIAKRTEELLQNPAVMNSLFFGPSELSSMYSKLMSIGGNDVATQQTILSAMESGIKKGLESLLPENPDHSRMIYPEAVRCLLVYIRFFDRPSLLETEAKGDIYEKFDARGTLISSLMETTLNLPFEGYKAFLKWATSIYTGELYIQNLVNPLLFQLEKSCRVTVDADQVMHTSLSVGAVPLIVSVLQWLYNASERLGIAKPEDFVCSVFDRVPVEALYHDLSLLKKARNSKEGVTQFYICESPFLFSPTTKRNLLKMENQVEMMKAAYNDGGIRVNTATGEVSVDAFFKLEIDREDMLKQTLAAIKKARPAELRKLLRVKFRGEEGVDAGGVTKEFFQLLSEELFDFGTGMWTDKYGDNITWFNSNCVWEDVRFELTGILVGLALYNSVLLDVHFPMAVYRKLLGYPLGLEDMVDLELKRGFRQLLDYEGDDVEDIFCLTFEVTWTDDLGEERKRELKPGGSNIPVTSENKEEYVRLYVSWLLVDSIYPQWVSFETGLLRVLEGSSIGLCRPEEVELLVVGSPELDFDALEANTSYEGGYDENSETVKCFWRFIKGIDRDAQTNFLKFATGSPKAPIGGLGALNFKIQRAGPDSQQLPTTHTCFNTLLLPDYGTDEKVSELLGRAIVECEGFGLE